MKQVKTNLVIVGGGGHAYSCIDVIEATGRYTIEGIIEKDEKIYESILHYKIIGSDADLLLLATKGHHFLIGVGQIKSSDIRYSLYLKLKSIKAAFATIISPYAYISKHSHLGEGTIVMHHALINISCEIGVNCIVNTKALIEHNSKIGDHCHISTGVIVNGNVTIGDHCFIGSNSTLFQGVKIPDGSVIPAGSIIKK